MAPIVLYQNKILLKDNKIATDLSCCCASCPTNVEQTYFYFWAGQVASNPCGPKGFRFASATNQGALVCPSGNRTRWQFSPAIGQVVTHVFNEPIKANCGAAIRTNTANSMGTGPRQVFMGGLTSFFPTQGTGGAFNTGAMEGFFVRCYDSFGNLINPGGGAVPLSSDTCTTSGRAYGVATNVTIPLLDGWSNGVGGEGGAGSNIIGLQLFTIPAGTKSLDIVVTENSNRLDVPNNQCVAGATFVGSTSWVLNVTVIGPQGNGALIGC